MENVTVLFGESGRTLRPKLESGTVLYGVNLRRAFEARYGFLESPQKAEEYDVRDGRAITFKHGYFDGRVIDKFEILAAGIRASGQIETSVTDAFIEDVIEWAASEAGLAFDESTDLVRVYTSILEVKCEGRMETLVGPMEELGKILAGFFQSYGAPRDDYALSGITAIGDPSIPGPGPFRFERRGGQPREANIYFSTAPLQTSDHIAVLERLEGWMR